jgi:predicted dehydrogenase
MSGTEFQGFGDRPLNLAMLGMVDGNGHPYSWSAMFNGYDPEAMAACPYATIPDYLGTQPSETLRIPDACVTHVWTDDPADAEKVAAASLIPNVVASPEDVIGHVDAVIVATDKGHEHVDRCRPFVKAGLPIFVDKPLVDNEGDLRIFREWNEEGHPILSSSALQYAKEFMPYRASTHDLGELRYATITTAKTWERYGIHALSGVYPIFGPGFLSARNTGTETRNVVHFKHACGADVVVVATDDMYGGFGVMQISGTVGSVQVASRDTFYMFKAQLDAYVSFLRTGERPFPWSETEELMKMLVAGIVSREEGGREVLLSEILA